MSASLCSRIRQREQQPRYNKSQMSLRVCTGAFAHPHAICHSQLDFLVWERCAVRGCSGHTLPHGVYIEVCTARGILADNLYPALRLCSSWACRQGSPRPCPRSAMAEARAVYYYRAAGFF